MFRVLHLSHDTALTERLVAALESGASVVRMEPGPETPHDMAAAVRPDLVAVDFGAGQAEFDAAMRIVQALHQADPTRPLVALGDERSSAMVLAAVRAGVRDFIDQAAPVEVLRQQIGAQLDQLRRAAARPAGRLVVVKAGQPNDGEGLFATNYAVLEAQRGNEVLLVDCHLPSTIAGPALDLGLNYVVRDAVHDLARLDRTLLETVLTRHGPSGLLVLPLALGAQEATEVTATAILAVVRLLRGMFGCVVVNLAGLQNVELVGGLMAEAERFYLVASQRLTSVKACRDMLTKLAAPEAEARITLVVSEHDPAITLTEVQMRTVLGVARSVRLPRAGAGLVNAANKGVPFVTEHPRAPYTRVLEGLAGAAMPAARPGWLRRMLAPRAARAPALRSAPTTP
jgi:pilus assembly protein CpaE